MKTIYVTKEWKGYGKQNYHWNEYRLLGDVVTKFNCHRQKLFDGHESYWNRRETKEISWNIKDLDLPEWLRKYL